MICSGTAEEKHGGLRFVLGNDEDGSAHTLDFLKKACKVYGQVKVGPTNVGPVVSLEDGIYFIIAVHSILDVPFQAQSYDFLSYRRACCMGGPSQKFTSKIITFKNRINF